MKALSILFDRHTRTALWTIALPIAMQNLITYTTNMMDTVMLGQLGEVAISGTSLGNQFGTIFMVLTCCSTFRIMVQTGAFHAGIGTVMKKLGKRELR